MIIVDVIYSVSAAFCCCSVCGHYSQHVRIRVTNQPQYRQKHFRMLQLFIMHCLLLS